jgi:hypothetical protein
MIYGSIAYFQTPHDVHRIHTPLGYQARGSNVVEAALVPQHHRRVTKHGRILAFND